MSNYFSSSIHMFRVFCSQHRPRSLDEEILLNISLQFGMGVQYFRTYSN
jgi:hypothetical protein